MASLNITPNKMQCGLLRGKKLYRML